MCFSCATTYDVLRNVELSLCPLEHKAQCGHPLMMNERGFAVCCGQNWRPTSESSNVILPCPHCGTDRSESYEHVSRGVYCGCCTRIAP